MNDCSKAKVARCLAWACLTLCFVAGCSTSAAVESVQLLPHWKKGDKVTFEMVKVGEQSQPGEPALKVTTRTHIDVEVLDTSDNGFVLAWTFGETTFDDPTQAANVLLGKLTNLVKGLRVVIELDSKGAIRGVQNWEEVKKGCARLLDTMADELKIAGIDESVIAKVREQVSSMYTTKEQIELLCTREANLFFSVLGIELQRGKPVVEDRESPNPFGGEPLPSRVQFDLQSVDKKTGLAVVKWQQTIDPEKTRKIMEKTIRDLAERMGKPAPKADMVNSLTVEGHALFTVDLSSGWIRTFKHKHTMKANGTLREETITVTGKSE